VLWRWPVNLLSQEKIKKNLDYHCLELGMTLFRSIILFCGTECEKYLGIFCGILLAPHYIVMNMNNVMGVAIIFLNENKNSMRMPSLYPSFYMNSYTK